MWHVAKCCTGMGWHQRGTRVVQIESPLELDLCLCICLGPLLWPTTIAFGSSPLLWSKTPRKLNPRVHCSTVLAVSLGPVVLGGGSGIKAVNTCCLTIFSSVFLHFRRASSKEYLDGECVELILCIHRLLIHHFLRVIGAWALAVSLDPLGPKDSRG